MSLVTPEELARHLEDPDWVVIDTRHELTNPETGPRAYAEGHIPGAYFMHVDHDLAAHKTAAAAAIRFPTWPSSPPS